MFHYINIALLEFGFFLKKHQKLIRVIQWVTVTFYLVLVVVPAFLPLPPFDAYLFKNFVLFSKFIFWGIWWPFVILSMICVGRMWCGIFCPEGALAEQTSAKFSRNKTIPQWIKWQGWPLVAFSLTTIYGQLTSVYDYAKPALLILGGSTIFAMIISFFYGARGTRVWCRFLCPVNGVFNLLSRLAPISYKVDYNKWDNYDGELPQNPHCAPMVKLSKLNGGADCHMCGRCNNFKNSISLQTRSMNEEIVKYGAFQTTIWDRYLLLFGMIALAIGAFTWTKNPYFITYKQNIVEFFINRNIYWVFNENAPWWILTNYPTIRDIFNWVDGFCLTSYILAYAIILGLFLNSIIYLCYRISNKIIDKNQFSMALLPLGFAGLFLGLSATTIKILNTANITISHVNIIRAFLLSICTYWCFHLAYKILKHDNLNSKKIISILSIFSLAPFIIVVLWLYMFWLW